MKMILGKLSPRKIVPSSNSNAYLKPNPDPDRGQFSGHHENYYQYVMLLGFLN